MQIQYDTDTACLLVSLDGEIDHHSSNAMRAEVDAAIYAHLPQTLIFDFSRVSFMDSSGIGLIMGRYKILSPLGGEILVQDPAPHISRILRLAGMERLAKICRSTKEVTQ
ncbi:MAG: anti-sigma factor antagonist [Oscillospiraceae bacterium]|nr:anti-sigma factor antagonist [Oscillospiraceae bacterium]MBR1899383.1 anti-sigma factor antagonist [Oscillospiraceae bacterium]